MLFVEHVANHFDGHTSCIKWSSYNSQPRFGEDETSANVQMMQCVFDAINRVRSFEDNLEAHHHWHRDSASIGGVGHSRPGCVAA